MIRVSPKPWARPVPPAVQIERVQVNGKTLSGEHTFKFLSGRHRLAIDFAVPTFFNRHNVRVRYRLDDSDADWVEAGDERVAYYTDLAPGDYRFQIIAANGDVWNEQGATIDLAVQPRWWERTETRVAMGCGILALGFLYARYRTRKIRRANIVLRREIVDRKRAEQSLRQREGQLRTLSGRLIGAQEDERRRIARELHDDLSQRLAVLAIETDSLVDDLGDDDGAAAKTRRLKDQIVGVSRDVHALSHELHPSILDDLGLVDALEAKCHQMSQRDELDVDFQHRGVPSSLPKDIALCLYRIVQESLRNVVKHSQTDRASVSLFVEDKQIVLSVSDAGVGFDVDQTGGQGGLGLASIEERTRLVGGELSIRSRLQEGTDITVRIPLEVGS